MVILNLCNRIIEYSFYALFFLVPLVIASDTSELFEFNKMWLTFGLSLIIAAAWLTKMILQRRICLQRTPLDIPIFLFLLFQFISTIFSWDMYISFWGYYSRFNAGLLSIISYVFLYYAFLSNFQANAAAIVKRLLLISLFSGLTVGLWGLPSHFGHDPTCFLFRQTFDVSCWTEDFQPRVRIFSTLGQPAWLAAYLAILLPISIIMFIKFIKTSIFYFLLSGLFYLDLLYSQARSGIIAVWLSLAFLLVGYILTVKIHLLKLSVILIMLLSITFFIGTPFSQISKFTFEGIKTQFTKNQIENPKNTIQKQTQPNLPQHSRELGGTDSGEIRKLVWQGALNTWGEHPFFGTGVETFAFAYYRYKLPTHNLLSEWNFLYNKAHNEFLNYLATTGVFGLGTYLLMIGWFLFTTFRYLFSVRESQRQKTGKVEAISKPLFRHSGDYGLSRGLQNLDSGQARMTVLKWASESENRKQRTNNRIEPLILALLAGYISILITNFFGFSVVITNLYLFIIPAFVFVLGGMIHKEKQFILAKNELGIRNYKSKISLYQWTFILVLLLTIGYLLFTLVRFWIADKNYAYGYNLDRAGEYLKAYPYLHKAVEQRNEPVFKDELSVNSAMLVAAMLSQKDSRLTNGLIAKARALTQEAITISNQLTSKYENNLVFWKTRTKIFYTLSQIDPQYLPQALIAIKKASELAPTDASISYNLGVLYGQNNRLKKAIEVLENTIKLKPDYQDAYYALGLFYHQEAIDKDGRIVNSALQKKAIKQMQYILDHFSNDDKGAQEALEAWKKQ